MSNGDLNIVVPTEKQLKLWDDTRAAVMWYAPAFTHVLYTLMNRSNYIAVFTDSSDKVPVAATDGTSVVVNTTKLGFFRFSLMERVFIVCHEILHAIFNHIILLYHVHETGKVVLASGKTLPLDEPLLQKALDYVINAILVQGNIGQMPQGALYDVRIATHLESAIDVYEKLWMQKHGGAKKPQMPQPNLPGSLPGGQNGSAEDGFDVHLPPGTVEGKSPHQAAQQRNEAEWNTVIKDAMESARAQGKLPAGLERLLEDLIETKITWTDHLHSFFARKVGSGASNWRKADRRLIVRDIWAPSRSGFGCDLIVFGNDTSGSIGQKEVSMWLGATGEVLEQLRPKRVIIIWCDAAVGRVDEVTDMQDLIDMQKKGAPGGGGTDFRPVFDYIWDERLEPDALVFLTDGYGTFPDKVPGYPVLWGSIALEASKYPFGDVVMLPKAE